MDTTSEAFFDAIYQRCSDPWCFATDPTERSRYADIVSLLGDRHFRFGFEPACSIGELTVMLAAHCDQLLATDISPRAVALARKRCHELANVEVRHGRLPDVLPRPGVDLVVLSEIGYYFTADDLAAVLDTLADVAAPGALLVGSHWTGVSADHLLSGSEVHTILGAHGRWESVSTYNRPSYVVGSWVRR
jgi:SAM-dependent methyltransferase